MIPIPIPFGVGGGKKVASLEHAAREILIDLNTLAFVLKWFLIFFTIYFVIHLGIRIFNYFNYRRRFEKMLILLHRLLTELFLLENIKEFKDIKKLDIELSCKESISQIKALVDSKFFVKRAGEHNARRMSDGLDMMMEKGVGLGMQMELVRNWMELVETLLACMKK